MTSAGAELADALLAGRYRLLERIAVGGMGEVWRAEDVLLSRFVAVKTLRAEGSCEPDRARLRAEARHAGRLEHPGIASVYDFGESGEQAWLVMELVDGEPLSDLLHREAPLSVDRTLDVVAQAALALHAAHLGGVVHRDVKPGNLLVRADGVLKVTDFGIASAVDAPSLTQTGLVVGTAYYLSPEQAAGRGGSPASDVYSLGVVAYECLTGERPFRGDNAVSVALAHLREAPPELPSSVPAQVRELVTRALAKRPGDRFPDAAAMANAARALHTGAPVPLTATGSAAGSAAGAAPAGRSGPAQRLPATEPVPVAAGTARAGRLPGSGRRSARAAVSSTLVLLVVLAAGAGARSMLTERDAPVEGRSVQAAPIRTVSLDGHTGRGVEQVRSALVEQGLLVRLSHDGEGGPVGTVSRVDPGGEVAVGSQVVVHVVPTPEPVPTPDAVPSPVGASPAAAAVAAEPSPPPVPPAVEEPVPAAPAPAGRGTTPDKRGKGDDKRDKGAGGSGGKGRGGG